MNPTHNFPTRRAFRTRAAASGLMASAVFGALLGTSALADMYRPPTNSAGGVQAQSAITSITPQGTNTTVCWYGMQGWYTVEAATNADFSGTVTPVGRVAASDHAWCATVANPDPTNSFFFRLNQLNAYVGSGGCAGCHGDKFSEYLGTEHAHAFDAITNELTQAGELVFHTVGYGQPSGFVDSTTTPYLKNVGCENCHGPAAWHKYSDHDLIRPAVSLDPKICGGCHQGEEHPIFEEYETTLHAEVNDDVRYGFDNGVYFTNTIVMAGTNVVAPGTPGSSNVYGFYVTTNLDLTLKTNQTTGIIHSQSGNPANLYDPGQGRQAGCGICHSAATRMAQLEDYEARLKGFTNALVFPAAQDAAAWTASCATCHDPHSNKYHAQLRNPTRSTNFYTMPTTADQRTIRSTNFQGTVTTNIFYMSAAFANMYDPNVQICAQCHNTRGARWDGRSYGYYNTNTLQSVTTNGPGIVWGVQTNVSFSRYPHYSPQYNVLVGIVQPDYLTVDASGVATNWLQRHGTSASSSSGVYNTNQCITCHVVADTDPVTGHPETGHTFELNLKGCTSSGCHSSLPDWEQEQADITDELHHAVALLMQWATNNAPDIIRTNYGPLAWEYTLPGHLGNPTGDPALVGPPNSRDRNKPDSVTNNNLQVFIPDAIKQARFNLYMVEQDGSKGIHNPRFVGGLITDATNKITSLIAATTNNAYFTASGANTGYTPFTVNFLSWGAGITNYSWDFGDGNTSSSANPSNTYSNSSTNTVTLTVTDSDGIVTTLTRTDFIKAYVRPEPSFVADVTTGTAPLTVYFTNTSTGTGDVTAWRWTVRSGVNVTTNAAVFPYTYTAAGTNNVSLRATTPAGNVTTTSNAYIIVTAPAP